jgi:hypothetical protein
MQNQIKSTTKMLPSKLKQTETKFDLGMRFNIYVTVSRAHHLSIHLPHALPGFINAWAVVE